MYWGACWLGAKSINRRLRAHCSRPVLVCAKGQRRTLWRKYTGTMQARASCGCDCDVRVWQRESPVESWPMRCCWCSAMRQAASGKARNGLAFPGDAMPNYMDFAYFSFTIGMTFQVSDVQVTDPNMRKLALTHGIISFFYATGILALTINMVAGLI